jgi:hypothetical protein
MSAKYLGKNSWVDDYNHVIVNVHASNKCKNDYCTLHNPSDHHMLGFPQRWRQDRHIMERMCPHGVGHPDPDDIALNTVHGCDGCCVKEIFNG